MVNRGDLWWADLGAPVGSRPVKRRPVLVIQVDEFNRSRIATVLVAVLTSNTELGGSPGNTFLPAGATGLTRDSVVNVTQLLTVNKTELTEPAGHLAGDLLRQVDAGLRLVLGLAAPTSRASPDLNSRRPFPGSRVRRRVGPWSRQFLRVRAG